VLRRLVGQATGGNRRGLNGGQLAWVTRSHSGVAVDIPLLAARYDLARPDASVTPDVVVPRSFAAQAVGVDQEAVRRLIDRKGQQVHEWPSRQSPESQTGILNNLTPAPDASLASRPGAPALVLIPAVPVQY